MSVQPKKSAVQNELSRLRDRVDELEQTLQAIQAGQVDALVMTGTDGVRVYSLEGAEHPYRVMIESIREGAATLDAQGSILYANGRMAELFSTPLDRLIGGPLHAHLPSEQWPRLRALIEQAHRRPTTCEVAIAEPMGTRRVLRLSFTPFRGSG